MVDTAAASSEVPIEVTLDDFNVKIEEKPFGAGRRASRRGRRRRSSLTTVEVDLLHAIASGKGKKGAAASICDAATAAAAAAAAQFDSENSAEETPQESDSSGAPPVAAAAAIAPRREPVARRRLRSSIVRHRDSLMEIESNFLEELLEAEDVDDAALMNTAKVLEMDVVFQQRASLSSTGSAAPQRSRGRRRSSVLSYKSNSALSSFKLEAVPRILEIEPEESPAKDVAYRKELWRTRQRSTINDDDSKGDVEEEVKVSVMTPEEESPLMSLFKNYVDYNSCAQVTDVEESSFTSGDESEEEGKEPSSTQGPVSFLIMGMSPMDDNATGLNVLTPPLMDTLRPHMPYAMQDDNYWLKYSLAQDGASIDILLSKVRSSSYTVLAIETMYGEVFGSFTSSPWRHRGPAYYGSCEAFLWRMAKNRRTSCETVLDRARLESDVEVFKWTGENRNIQMCSSARMLAVGGGEADKVIEWRLLGKEEVKKDTAPPDFGLALNHDLSSGSSGRCVTFGLPYGLSREGSTFEISNVEVWTLTPMADVPQAEKLELSRQFVFSSAVADASIQPERVSKMARAA